MKPQPGAYRTLLQGRRVKVLTPEAAAALADQGFVAYCEAPRHQDKDLRLAARRRTHLRSAKLIDAANAFLCEALVQDLSSGGMRLRLARNIGLPPRFGVHDDDSGALFTVSPAWRRGLAVGVRIHSAGPPSPMKGSDRAALGGRYYGVRN
jgi:hypothetical protein